MLNSQPKRKDSSEVKHPIFEAGGLPPSVSGFEVIVRSTFVLKDAVTQSAQVLTLNFCYELSGELFQRHSSVDICVSYLWLQDEL